MNTEHILILSKATLPDLAAAMINRSAREDDDRVITLVVSDVAAKERLALVSHGLEADVSKRIHFHVDVQSTTSELLEHAIRSSEAATILCSTADGVASDNIFETIDSILTFGSREFLFPVTDMVNQLEGSNCLHASHLAFRGELSGFLPPLMPSGPEGALQTLALALSRVATPRLMTTVYATENRPSDSFGTQAPRAATFAGISPSLSIVIPTLDAGSPRTRSLLASLAHYTDVPYQTIIVDNGNAPQGFSRPVNTALRAVNTPYVAVLNDDVEVEFNWWSPLQTALDSGKRVVFPRTTQFTRSDFSAWCFAMTRETLQQFSHRDGEFFDVELSIWFQDSDLLLKLYEADEPPHLVEDSTISHSFSATLSSEDPQLKAWILSQIRRDKERFVERWGHAGLDRAGYREPALPLG